MKTQIDRGRNLMLRLCPRHKKQPSHHSQPVTPLYFSLKTEPQSNSPPINPQNLPTHPPTRLPTQKRHHLRHLLWRPDAIGRTEPRNRLDHGLRLPVVKELGGDGAGGDGVDGDAVAQEVLGHDVGHLLDGAFGGAVEEVVGLDVGGGGDGGGEEDDAGAGGHVGDGFLWGNGEG